MITKSEFHLKIYSKPISTEYLEEFETDERTILIWRTGLSIINIKPTICLYRSYAFLKHCASPQKQCFIPFSMHRKAIKNDFYSLSLLLLFFLSPNF